MSYPRTDSVFGQSNLISILFNEDKDTVVFRIYGANFVGSLIFLFVIGFEVAMYIVLASILFFLAVFVISLFPTSLTMIVSLIIGLFLLIQSKFLVDIIQQRVKELFTKIILNRRPSSVEVFEKNDKGRRYVKIPITKRITFTLIENISKISKQVVSRRINPPKEIIYYRILVICGEQERIFGNLRFGENDEFYTSFRTLIENKSDISTSSSHESTTLNIPEFISSYNRKTSFERLINPIAQSITNFIDRRLSPIITNSHSLGLFLLGLYLVFIVVMAMFPLAILITVLYEYVLLFASFQTIFYILLLPMMIVFVLLLGYIRYLLSLVA